MGGGGGNDSGNGGGGDETPALTPYDRAPVAQTFQPHLPGMEGMIAGQLGKGFGGNQGGIAEMLSGLYKPMTLQRFFEPISTTAATFDKTKHSPIATGNPALDRLLMGQKIGKEESK